MTRDVQPIFILPEGTTKTTGKSAQRMNIEAAKLVADQVRTTLGPKGMDKMIVGGLGDVTVTNDGVTILKEMNIEHPSAKMIVDVAKTQDDEVGDGTTTVVVLAGEFLKNAQSLLEQNIHPTIITKGYRLAAEKAQTVLNSIAEPVTLQNMELLKSIASTAMIGRGSEFAKDFLATLVVDAVTGVAERANGTVHIDPVDIKLEKKVGSGIESTELIKGVVLDKERVHAAMPTKVKNAKILLLDAAIEVKDTETDAKISITDPAQMQAFIDQEEKMIKDKVEAVAKTGANVIICQKGIDDYAQYLLAKKGIYAVRRVKKSDMDALARATGAQVASNIKEVSEKDLGRAGLVEELKIGDEQMTLVKECENPKSLTLLVRGGTEHIAEEVKRALQDAVGGVIAALSNGKVVAGGGAVEIALAKALKEYSKSLSGKEQLAAQAFAEAVEVIPRTLAESAGLDPIDKLAELRAAHENGLKWAGINVFTGKVMDSWKERVVEPLKIITQAVKLASEVSTLILRIDDVIAGGSASDKMPQMPQGMPGMSGMGGY